MAGSTLRTGGLVSVAGASSLRPMPGCLVALTAADPVHRRLVYKRLGAQLGNTRV